MVGCVFRARGRLLTGEGAGIPQNNVDVHRFRNLPDHPIVNGPTVGRPDPPTPHRAPPAESGRRPPRGVDRGEWEEWRYGGWMFLRWVTLRDVPSFFGMKSIFSMVLSMMQSYMPSTFLKRALPSTSISHLFAGIKACFA